MAYFSGALPCDTSMIMRVDRYSRGTMLPICMYSASLEWAPKPDRPMPSMTGPR